MKSCRHLQQPHSHQSSTPLLHTQGLRGGRGNLPPINVFIWRDSTMGMRPDSEAFLCEGRGLDAHILLLPAATTMLLQTADEGKVCESHMVLGPRGAAPHDSSFWMPAHLCAPQRRRWSQLGCQHSVPSAPGAIQACSASSHPQIVPAQPTYGLINLLQ